jgi:hypothetical protein
MQPESSDGFASVGTILPKEEAALLPGGFFAFQAAKTPCFKNLNEACPAGRASARAVVTS